MFLTDNAHLVCCPSERAYLDQSGEVWVRDRAKAGFWTRSSAIQLSLSAEWPYGRRHVQILYALVCNCCGAVEGVSVVAGPPTQGRCEQHVGRNPCAIEGCRRTREGTRPALDSWLCGAHWRQVSRQSKRVYARIWRLQKKSGGWTDLLRQRHWRVWGAIVLEARRAARGDVDMKEVGELFGWADA